MFIRSGGGCVAHFESTEAAVIREVLSEIIELLTGKLDRTDPVIDRLFPDMYREDPESSAELRLYTETDLRSTKLEQAREVLEYLPQSGGRVFLTTHQSETWLRALTDARLALGMRLNITADTDVDEELDEAVMRDPTSAQVGNLSVYEYLTFLQESLVGVLMG